jgi:plastocyanin
MKMQTNRIIRVAGSLVLVLTLGGTISSRAGAQGDKQAFPETGKTVKGVFLDYWRSHGGLAQQGYPISEEMQERSDTDGKTYTVQYFERAVFELHPENPAPNNVLLSLLGNFLYQQKYKDGAPNQTANKSAGSVLFEATGKWLGGTFLEYWRSHGGLAQQGYPISDEFTEKSELDGKTYKVQYFERAVFELHLENKPPFDVLLSQLGTFRYKQKYAAAGQAGVTPGTTTDVSVNIIDFDFAPPDITVPAGTKVTWTNKDASSHTVADEGRRAFSSEVLRTGNSFSFTATSPGTIRYLCTLHPLMKGTITVR